MFVRWETRVWRHSASVHVSNVLGLLARSVIILPVFSTPSKLYRALERAGKVAEEAFGGGTGRRRQQAARPGLDDGSGGPGKRACPAADGKDGLPAHRREDACGWIKAYAVSDTG